VLRIFKKSHKQIISVKSGSCLLKWRGPGPSMGNGTVLKKKEINSLTGEPGMTPSGINIEELIPHRGRMKLIDEVVEVDEETAVTESVVKENWPLVKEDSVSPLILIELVAQTAGACVGWKEAVKEGLDIEGRTGWLVGIKRAFFYLDKIPLNARIQINSKRSFSFENYYEILGIAKIDSQVVGKVKLQIVRPD
jgi:predicted hotdog family 3-hydroxylacyl-ACP dehydratase